MDKGLALTLIGLVLFSMAAVADGGATPPTAAQATQAAQTQDALQKTQALLVDPTQRSQTIKKDPESQKVDAAVRQLMETGANTDEIYKLAADVFANVVKSSNGDPIKMKEAMEKFQRDPASFANTWTPEQKAKLKELADKLSSQVPGQN